MRFKGSFGFALDGLRIPPEQYELIPSHARREGDFQFPRWKQTFIRQNREFFRDNASWITPVAERVAAVDLPVELPEDGVECAGRGARH